MDDCGNLIEDLPADMQKRARQQVAKMASNENGQQVARMEVTASEYE